MASPNIVTSLNLDDPQTLVAMLGQTRPAPRFLINRYFPTNPDTDIFPSETILVDYKDKQGRILAPLVHEGHKTTPRRTFRTDKLTPARIAPQRPLTVVNLIKRGFGESLFSGDTPAQRAVNLTINDFTDLTDEVKRVWEKMAADCLTTNTYTLTYVASDAAESGEVTGDVTVSFIDTVSGNAAAYTPATAWNAAGANILGDIKAMIQQMQDNGAIGGEVDLVLGSDAAIALMQNEDILTLLNIRRVEAGNLSPRFIELGAALIGQLNVHGHFVNIIEYTEKYTDSTGALVPFLPAGAAFVANPGCGRAMFAAVTQMEQYDHAFHTYMEPIVPKILGDASQDSLKIQLTSRPLLAPVVVGGWVAATVIEDSSEG